MRFAVISLVLTSAAVVALYTADGSKKVSKQKEDAVTVTNAKTVQVRLLGEDGTPTELREVERVVKSDAEWQKQLTEEQYKIARGKGRSRRFAGRCTTTRSRGFTCVCAAICRCSLQTRSLIQGPGGRVFSSRSRRRM